MFYNYAIATTCGVIGGVCMYEKEDYRKMIMALLEMCDDLHWLKTIYAYVKRLIG